MGGGGCGRCITKVLTPNCGRCISKAIKRIIFGDEETSGSVGRMDSYDENIAEANMVIMVQEALTAFRTRSENAADRLENDVLRESREYLDRLLDFLGNINENEYGGQSLDLKLDRVERDARKTEDIIHGYIKRKIQKRVSLDDEECKDILKMEKGQEKEKAMTVFLNKIIKEALTGLAGEVKKSLKIQLNNIEDQINSKIEAYKILTKSKLDQFQEIQGIKNKDEKALLEKVYELEYHCALCEVGNQIMEEQE